MRSISLSTGRLPLDRAHLFRGMLVAGALGAAFAAPGMTATGSRPAQDVNVVNTTASPLPTQAQGTTAIAGSVNVTNTSQSPVPVGGSVNISNTPGSPVPTQAQGTTNVAGSVSVSNTADNPVPTQVQGTATVAGSVSISNTAAAPVPVHNLDADLRQPLEVDLHGGWPTGEITTETDNPYQVPAGMRFVIQHISGSIRLANGQQLLYLELDHTSANGVFTPPEYLLTTYEGTLPHAFDGFTVSEEHSLIAGPSDTLNCRSERSGDGDQGDGDNAFMDITLTGFLEPAPQPPA